MKQIFETIGLELELRPVYKLIEFFLSLAILNYKYPFELRTNTEKKMSRPLSVSHAAG